jgi:hypothetical protein
MEANAASHSVASKGKGKGKGKGMLERPLSTGSLGLNLSESTPLLLPPIMESFVPPTQIASDPKKILRFQVVIWYIGLIDMIQGRVPVTFRVTLFWNAPDEVDDPTPLTDELSTTSASKSEWKMHGRQEAVQKELKDLQLQTVDVPPVSILNVVTFETIGQPEVSLLNEGERLMRWYVVC